MPWNRDELQLVKFRDLDNCHSLTINQAKSASMARRLKIKRLLDTVANASLGHGYFSLSNIRVYI